MENHIHLLIKPGKGETLSKIMQWMLISTFEYICNNPVKAEMVEDAGEYLYGALWFIRHRLFDIVAPHDIFPEVAFPD